MVEATAAIGAVNAALGVLSKLIPLLGKEYKLLKGLEEKVKSIQGELRMMKVALENRDESDPLREEWLRQLGSLAGEMKDVLGKFLEMNPVQSDETNCSCLLRTFILIKTLCSRHKLATKIAKLKSRLDELAKTKDLFEVKLNSVGGTSAAAAAVNVRQAAFYSQERDEELFGILDEAERLAKWLDSSGGTSRCVLAIVGLGGIGKTTLAKAIFRQLAEAKFNCRARVMVTQNFNAKNVLENILSQICPEWSNVQENQEDLIHKIQNILANQRYLILVDDLWKVEDWFLLEKAFPRSEHGGAIVVTTRDRDVANGCAGPGQAYQSYKAKKLKSLEAQNLFFKHYIPLGVSGSTEDNSSTSVVPPSELIKILSICDGLPLAIITIASLPDLRSARGKEQWEEVLESLMYEIKDENKHNLNGLRGVLSLSYKRLTKQLQDCLLYVSIFPIENETINKDQLVRQWIAHDYVADDERLTAEKVGNKQFNDLVKRSLIDPVNIRYDGEIVSCRVHKIMHELIILKAMEEKKVALTTPQNVKMAGEANTHWSFQNCEMPTLSGKSRCKLFPRKKPQCKSLNMFRCHLVRAFDLKSFDSLKVLNLKDCKGLNGHNRMDSICQLAQLRYLGLEKVDVVSLPEKIDKLEHLVTLDLRETKITELPNRLVHLTKLAHLVCHDSEVACLPGIGEMKSLQTLCGFNIRRSSLTNIDELGKLTNLRDLYFEGESDEDQIDAQLSEIILSVLSKLFHSNLYHLGLHLGSKVHMEFLDHLTDHLTDLSHVEALRRFTMGGKIKKIPRWFSKLEGLSYLQLGEICLQSEDMEILGQLRYLMFLELKLQESSETLSFVPERFLSLTRLVLNILKDRQENLIFEEGSLPQLELLYMFYWDVEDHADIEYKCCRGIEHLRLREIAVGSIDKDKARRLKASIVPQIKDLLKPPCVKTLRNKEEATKYYNQRVIWRSYSEDLPSVERDHMDVQLDGEGSNGLQQGENSNGGVVDGCLNSNGGQVENSKGKNSSPVDASIHSQVMPVKETTAHWVRRAFSATAESSFETESGSSIPQRISSGIVVDPISS